MQIKTERRKPHENTYIFSLLMWYVGSKIGLTDHRDEGRVDKVLVPSCDLLYTRYPIPNEEVYMGFNLFKNELDKPTTQ